jgi:hypothetical protein
MINVCVIYPNTQESRNSIFGKLVEWSKKIDLETQGISANHFKVVKGWPPKEVLENFPLNLQIEEIIIENDKITTIRKLVVDAEIIENSTVEEIQQKETSQIIETTNV